MRIGQRLRDQHHRDDHRHDQVVGERPAGVFGSPRQDREVAAQQARHAVRQPCFNRPASTRLTADQIDRVQQVGRDRALQYEGVGAGVQRRLAHGLLVVDAQDDHLQAGAAAAHRARPGEAVAAGQRQIDDRHVRLQPARALDQRSSSATMITVPNVVSSSPRTLSVRPWWRSARRTQLGGFMDLHSRPSPRSPVTRVVGSGRR